VMHGNDWAGWFAIIVFFFGGILFAALAPIPDGLRIVILILAIVLPGPIFNLMTK
jgi:hypothetical protein